MNCPNCTGEMDAGEAFFKKSAADFAVFGLGSEDLRMKRDDGVELLLLTSSEKVAAQLCRECGVPVIATERGRRTAARKIVS